MRKCLIYSVLLLILVNSYWGGVGLSYGFLSIIFPDSPDYFYNISAFAAVLITWQLYLPVQKLIDWLFYRQTFDPDAMYTQYIQASEKLLDRQSLAELTFITLQQTLEPISACLTMNTPQGDISFNLTSESFSGEQLKLDIQFQEQVFGHLVLGASSSKRPYNLLSQTFAKKLMKQLAVRLYVLELTENQIQLSLKTQQLEIKTHFLERLTTHLSHDLKSPLVSCHNLINKTVFFLKEEKPLSELDLERVLHRLLHCFTKLSEYISLSLDREILELGRLKLEQEAVNVRTVCEEVLALHEDFAEAKHLHVEFVYPSETVYILGDRIRFELVVSNLVSNALKYGKKHIVLQIKTLDQQIVFTVQDDGLGIPAKMQTSIFELYGNSDTPHSLLSSGFGLGICKQYILLMGGTIELSSSASGTSFELCFPVLEVIEQNTDLFLSNRAQK